MNTMQRIYLPLLLLVALSLSGCISYNSSYVQDPRTLQTHTGLDRSAAQIEPPRLVLTTQPSAIAPQAPLRVQLSRAHSGPETETTSFQENSYRHQWTPLLIPLGVLLVPSAPLGFLGGVISGDGEKAFDMFYGSDPNPCKENATEFGLNAIIGVATSCTIVDRRMNEVKTPTGRTISEKIPVVDKPVELRLSAKAEQPIVQTYRTDSTGTVAINLQPFFALYRDYPVDVEANLRVIDEENAAITVAIDAATARLLYLPIAEERAGDQARAAGKGLIALDHYSRAGNSKGDPAVVNPGLWTKITSTYRALPLKPLFPEEARRLSVQAETLSRNDNATGAIQKLGEAIEMAPWMPVLRYNLAMAQAMEANYSAAITTMNHYLDLAPDAPDARQAKDKIYEWETLTPPPDQGTQRSVQNEVQRILETKKARGR